LFIQVKKTFSTERSVYVENHFETKEQGVDSQNFLRKFVRFFLVTLGLKILRLFRLKVLFEADIMQG